MTKILKNTSQLFSFIFNPFLMPTMGFLIVYINMPGVELYTPKMRNILTGIVFVSTFVLPIFFVMLMAASKRINYNMMHHRERLLPYIFSAFSILLGAQLMGKLPVPNVYKTFMLATCLILIILFFITMKWKISGHASGMGGFTALLIAVSLKYGIDLAGFIIAAVIVSGFVCTSRLYLKKHNPAQVYAGFGISSVFMFLIIYFL
ncbi:MAG: phosphatase PAP2 family protein [Prolixibacteraceae bacterium]|jgi:membrane-associated phospholipid phosphatase|nr:phosphatase PAP2 family protein [Prolixibacteraceae bacterium]